MSHLFRVLPVHLFKNQTYLKLFLIVLIGLFFRVYNLGQFYSFAHDQDLYSWIVKDIWIDHHIRLVGQFTSIDGVLVGPLFYYLLIPFFVFFKMDPIGATMLATIIGLLTIISIYIVFSKLFDNKTALIGAFIYAVSVGAAFFDRWVVPTEPTHIWAVWYLFVAINIARGNLKYLPILGVLLGLTWHIHLALLPLSALLIICFAISASKKIPLKETLISLSLILILTLPFFLFEIRHGFSQSIAFVDSLGINRQESEGLYRLIKISEISTRFLSNIFFKGINLPTATIPLVSIFLLIYIKIKKIVLAKDLIIIIGWAFFAILGQAISKRGISEYYFANLTPIFLLLFSLFLASFYQRFKKIVLVFLGVVLIANLWLLFATPEFVGNYSQKRQAIEYIKKDADQKGFACVGINYITDIGNSTGYRYLTWKNNLNTISPGKGEPVYSIVMPWFYSKDELAVRFVDIGVIKPKIASFTDAKLCNDPQNQLLPLLGFTD